ncbi:hypothetical protein [Alkalihalobacillus sp. CinArs1]|uniref:hypothetical protein n=1 Tax=Alkalihalobacillus sp. CinArs1 TaxID=2995314 RepID=UPI0022DDFB0E|nr:hypothetical protein [Alkalihalobacillus sp. CinArs1]
MSEPTVSIALYRPHPGKEEDLQKVVKDHLPTLRREGLITEQTPLHLQANDGTILEIFQWKSIAAKDEAHQSDVVMEVWEKFMAVAEMTTLSSLEEANQPFPNFKPITF